MFRDWFLSSESHFACNRRCYLSSYASFALLRSVFVLPWKECLGVQLLACHSSKISSQHLLLCSQFKLFQRWGSTMMKADEVADAKPQMISLRRWTEISHGGIAVVLWCQRLTVHSAECQRSKCWSGGPITVWGGLRRLNFAVLSSSHAGQFVCSITQWGIVSESCPMC